MTRKLILASCVAAAFSVAHPARADNLFGEFKRLPDQIERGFSLGFDFGLSFFTGDKQSAKNPGFLLSFTGGYDIFKYLSIEAISTIGITEAAQQDPVLQGGVNTFLFNMAAKGQYPLGRWYPFLEVGGGVHFSDPPFDPGENWKPTILMGAGMEYYTYLRHYSFFLKGTYVYSMQPVDLLGMSLGMRYTF